MKNIFPLFAILLLSSQLRAQAIPALSADDIIRRTSSKDTVYVINFWATWCAPCVAELPEFNDIQQRFSRSPVKVLLVSLDFKEDRTYKLESFISRRHIEPEVVWLSDTNPNVFIPKFENSWEGSIPATIVVHPGKGLKKFIKGTVTDEQVSRVVTNMLKQ